MINRKKIAIILSYTVFSFILTVFTSKTAVFAQDEIDFPGMAKDADQYADEELDFERQQDEMTLEYNRWILNHTKRAFMWNHISSIAIFFIVLTVIFSGLYFSYLQFQKSILPNKTEDLEQSSIKMGANGFEVSSSVIGLLILIVSLAFLYLYLDNVYPVTFVDSIEDATKESSPYNPIKNLIEDNKEGETENNTEE